MSYSISQGEELLDKKHKNKQPCVQGFEDNIEGFENNTPSSSSDTMIDTLEKEFNQVLAEYTSTSKLINNEILTNMHTAEVIDKSAIKNQANNKQLMEIANMWQQSGCTNLDALKNVDWWKKVGPQRTSADMHAYCDLTLSKKGNARQKKLCGPVKSECPSPEQILASMNDMPTDVSSSAKCLFKLPSGCPRQDKRFSAKQIDVWKNNWSEDKWGQKNRNAGNSSEACLGVRRREFNNWCNVKDAKMYYRPNVTSSSKTAPLTKAKVSKNLIPQNLQMKLNHLSERLMTISQKMILEMDKLDVKDDQLKHQMETKKNNMHKIADDIKQNNNKINKIRGGIDTMEGQLVETRLLNNVNYTKYLVWGLVAFTILALAAHYSMKNTKM